MFLILCSVVVGESWLSSMVALPAQRVARHLKESPLVDSLERSHRLEQSNGEAISRVLSLVDDPEYWEPVVTDGRTRVWRLLDSERHACILAKGVINAAPSKVYDLFVHAHRARDFNEYCDTCVDIQQLNHNTKVSWSVTKPFGNGLFKARDFVTLCHYRDLSDGSRCIINHATTHPLRPASRRYQRAEVVLAANIIKPHGAKGTHLTLLTQVNPGGAIDTSIGARIVNQIVKRSPVAFFDAVEKAARDV